MTETTTRFDPDGLFADALNEQADYDPEALVSEPERRYPVLPDYAFQTEFERATDLEDIVRHLIAKHPASLSGFDAFAWRCYWKREGGGSRGRIRRGKASRPSGLAKSLMGNPDGLVWLAADVARMQRFTYRQIEALMFHELLFFEVDWAADPPKLNTRPIEVEVWFAEIESYGLWQAELDPLGEIVRQLPLPMGGAA